MSLSLSPLEAAILLFVLWFVYIATQLSAPLIGTCSVPSASLFVSICIMFLYTNVTRLKTSASFFRFKLGVESSLLAHFGSHWHTDHFWQYASQSSNHAAQVFLCNSVCTHQGKEPSWHSTFFCFLLTLEGSDSAEECLWARRFVVPSSYLTTSPGKPGIGALVSRSDTLVLSAHVAPLRCVNFMNCRNVRTYLQVTAGSPGGGGDRCRDRCPHHAWRARCLFLCPVSMSNSMYFYGKSLMLSYLVHPSIHQFHLCHFGEVHWPNFMVLTIKSDDSLNFPTSTLLASLLF